MSRKIHVLASGTVYTYDDSGAEIASTSASSGSAVAANPGNDNELYYSSGDTLYRTSTGGSITAGHQPGETIKDIAVSEDFLYILHGDSVTQIDHTDIANPVRTITVAGTGGTLDLTLAIDANDSGFVVYGEYLVTGWVAEYDTLGSSVTDFYASDGTGDNPDIAVSPNNDYIVVCNNAQLVLFDSSRALVWGGTANPIRATVNNNGEGIWTAEDSGGEFDTSGVLSSGEIGYNGDTGGMASIGDDMYYARSGSASSLTEPAVAKSNLVSGFVWSDNIAASPDDIAVWEYSGPEPTEGDWSHTEATTNDGLGTWQYTEATTNDGLGTWAHTEVTTNDGLGAWAHSQATSHDGIGDWTHTEVTTHNGKGDWAYTQVTTHNGVGGWAYTQAATDPLVPEQAFIDFSGEAIGSLPTGWSLVAGSSTAMEIADPGDTEYGRALKINATTGGTSTSIQYDAGPASANTVELTARLKCMDTTTRDFSLSVFDPGPGEQRVQFDYQPQTTLRILDRSGPDGTIAEGFTFSPTADTYWLMRAQYVVNTGAPNTFRFRAWFEVDPEPTTWLEGTYDNSFDAAIIGVQNWENPDTFIDWIGVGTEGLEAPLGPTVEEGEWAHTQTTTHNGIGDWAHVETTTHNGIGDWAFAQVTSHNGLGEWTHTQVTSHNGLGEWSFTEVTSHNGVGDWTHTETSTHSGKGSWAHVEVTTHNGEGVWAFTPITTEPGEGAWTNTEATTDNGIGSWADAETSTTVGQGVWNSTETSTNIGEGSWASAQTSTNIGEGSWASAETATGAGEGAWASTEVTTDLAPGEAGDWGSAETTTLNDKGAWASAESTTDIGEGTWSNTPITTDTGIGEWGSVETATQDGIGTWSSSEVTTSDGIGTWASSETQTNTGVGAWSSTTVTTDDGIGSWASTEATTSDGIGAWASAGVTTQDGIGSWANADATTDTGIGAWANADATTKAVGQWASSIVVTDIGVTRRSGYKVGPLRVSGRHLQRLPSVSRTAFQPHHYTEMIQIYAQTNNAQNDFGEVITAESLVYEGDAQVDDKGLASEHLSGSALQDKELIYVYLPVAEMPELLKTGDRLEWQGQDYTIHKIVELSSLVIAVK